MAIRIDNLVAGRRAPAKSRNFTVDYQASINREFSFFKGLSNKDKLSVYSEIELLLNAGLDLENCLSLIKSQQKEGTKLFRLFGDLILDIISGKSLSMAMEASGKFTEYEFYSIQIGEETGKLASVIENLRQFYSDLIDQRRKLISALSYPMVVLLVAIGAVFFLLRFVVPLFQDVFNRFDGELPYLTRIIISLSENAGRIFPWLLSLLILTTFIWYSRRKKEGMRKLTSQTLLRLPIIGVLAKKIYLARLFNAMSLLISSRNPLLHSISMIRKMVGFYPLEQSLERMEKDILLGKSLYESMEKDPLFDKQTLTLIKVAEEAGQLKIVLERISEGLSKDINHRLNNLGSLLEPVLIIFVGGLVAIILVAMYLPLFNLSTTIY